MKAHKKETTEGGKNKEKKEGISYLNKSLVRPYLEKIGLLCLNERLPYYEKKYKNIFAINSMAWDFLVVINKILDIIYMREIDSLNRPGDLTFDKQLRLIVILQSLNKQTSFDVIKGQLNELPGWKHTTDFETLFEFLNSPAIFSDKKEVPNNIRQLCNIADSHFPEEVTQGCMTCLSEMTINCIHDFIEDALEHFSRLFPSVDLTGIVDARMPPQAPPKKLTSNTVRFSFSQEAGPLMTTEEIAVRENLEPHLKLTVP